MLALNYPVKHNKLITWFYNYYRNISFYIKKSGNLQDSLKTLTKMMKTLRLKTKTKTYSLRPYYDRTGKQSNMPVGD